jgi:hypothetical protein
MKNYRCAIAISWFLFLLTSLAVAPVIASEFDVREYDEFHDILRPLQHEALPAKDFKRIRSHAAELVKKGEAILTLGVPKGTSPEGVEEFSRGLKKFATALMKFSQQSKDGSDEQLELSFSQVHDSFEMLAGMLPRK